MEEQKYTLEDFVYIETKCRECERKGMSLTLAKAAEDPKTVIGKQLAEDGYAGIICSDCQKEK